MAVVAAGLQPLLPGRASLSQSWIRDKEKITRGASWADRKVPGRASLSSSWVDDKKLGHAGTSNSSVERAGRSTWRDSCRSLGKRPASRAPSADQTERKQKPLITETEAAPATTVATKTEAAASNATETEAAPSQEMLFAGPSFIAVSPDPSELPLPTSLILRRLARVCAAYVIAELSSSSS